MVLVRAEFDCVLLCEQEGLLHLEEPLGSSCHCHYHWCQQKSWNKMRKFSFFINRGQGNKQGSKEKSLGGKLTRGRSYLCSLARRHSPQCGFHKDWIKAQLSGKCKKDFGVKRALGINWYTDCKSTQFVSCSVSTGELWGWCVPVLTFSVVFVVPKATKCIQTTLNQWSFLKCLLVQYF